MPHPRETNSRRIYVYLPKGTNVGLNPKPVEYRTTLVYLLLSQPIEIFTSTIVIFMLSRNHYFQVKLPRYKLNSSKNSTCKRMFTHKPKIT